MDQPFVVVFQSLSTENAYSAQMNGSIYTIYPLLLEYFKVQIKNSGDFSDYYSKIVQFDRFLSALEQKRLENHEIYNIGAAENTWDFHIAHLS